MHRRWSVEARSMMASMLIAIGHLLTIVGNCMGIAELRRSGEAIMAHGAPATMEMVLAEMLDSAAQDINIRLATATQKLVGEPDARGPQFRQTREAELLAQVQKIRARYAIESRPLITAANEAAYKAGLANSERQLREMGIKEAGDAVGGVSFNLINERAIEAFATDSAARMNAAINSHSINAVSLFRSFSKGALSGQIHERATNDILAKGIISGDPRGAIKELRGLIGNSIGADETESYRKVGNKLIEVGKATISVRHYAMTVVRTRTREATTEAQINRQLSVGIDLVQVTGLESENFCTRFLGMVFALRGARDGYPSVSEVGRTPFHPNCSKTFTAYHPDLVSAGRVDRAEAAGRRFERDKAAGVLFDDLRSRRKAA